MAQTRKTSPKANKAASKPAKKSATRPATSTTSGPARTTRTGGKKTATLTRTAGDGDNPVVAMVRGLAEIVETHSLSELIYDTPDITVTLRRGHSGPATMVQHAMPAMSAPAAAMPSQPAAAAPAPAEPTAPEPPADDQHHVVTSPFVGTFYRRPNPDTEPYAKAGDRVEKGQVLCIVEAMKLMNEIEADATGTIVEVLVEDGKPVEYDQPLFKIATA